MPAAGVVFVLLFVAAIAGTIVLWSAIDRETDENPTMDRSDAERAVRQDTEDGQHDDADRDDTADDWESGSEWGDDESDRR